MPENSPGTMRTRQGSLRHHRAETQQDVPSYFSRSDDSDGAGTKPPAIDYQEKGHLRFSVNKWSIFWFFFAVVIVSVFLVITGFLVGYFMFHSKNEEAKAPKPDTAVVQTTPAQKEQVRAGMPPPIAQLPQGLRQRAQGTGEIIDVTPPALITGHMISRPAKEPAKTVSEKLQEQPGIYDSRYAEKEAQTINTAANVSYGGASGSSSTGGGTSSQGSDDSSNADVDTQQPQQAGMANQTMPPSSISGAPQTQSSQIQDSQAPMSESGVPQPISKPLQQGVAIPQTGMDPGNAIKQSLEQKVTGIANVAAQGGSITYAAREAARMGTMELIAGTIKAGLDVAESEAQKQTAAQVIPAITFAIEFGTSHDIPTARDMVMELQRKKIDSYILRLNEDDGVAHYHIRSGVYDSYNDAYDNLRKMPQPFAMWGKVVKVEPAEPKKPSETDEQKDSEAAGEN